LLQLDAVAIDWWKRRPELEPQKYTMNIDFPADQRDDVVDDLIYIESQGFERALFGQRADAHSITSLACFALPIICSTALSALSIQGTSRSSHRRHASPNVTTVASGWFTS
jgi:hypothetical protein